MLKEDQKNIIIGGILGDSYVEKNRQNCRIRFDHSIKQQDYCAWKHKKLHPYTTKLVQYTVFDPRTNKSYEKVKFDTTTNPIFNEYHEAFYSNKRKCIPSNIGTYLSSTEALAIWYLDDGALRRDCRALRIHTNNLTWDEIRVLQQTLSTNFQIESKIHKQGTGFNIYIGSSGKQSEKFCNLIQPFVASEIPSMLYKFLKPCND